METANLTSFQPTSNLGYMKKHISTLSVRAIARIAHEATHKAALDAVAAGRTIACWENGRLVEYGPGALPLPSEEESVHVRIA